jgi:hypothetical protein
MAFGLLASVVPEVNKTTTLYSSEEDVTVQGKVVVSNKNYNPVKVRLGITSGPSLTSYIEYNKIVNYGETFETEDIYFGDGQSLIIRTDSSNTDFLFYGQTYVDSNPVKSGLVGAVNSTNTNRKVLFEAPIQSQAIVSLSICNLDSFPAKARVGITSATGFNTSNYIEYDVEVLPFQTYNRKELLLDAGQSLICSSNKDSNLNFTCHGRLYYGSGGGAEDNLVVLGNARIDGNVGIGTLLARSKLDVIGNTLLSGNLTVGGELVATLSPSSVNTALIGLGTLPSLDGSALTGVIATGSGVEVKNNGNPVGTARTLDFGGGNLEVDFSQGSANIRTSDNIYIPLGLTVGQNKFNVSGLTGNTAIHGYVSIASTLSVNGNVNILNNKVKNVGIPTVPNDATNKSYVDARSIIMSIALS